MKRLAIFACVMIVGAGAAIAATVSIPFFNDGGQDAFITVQNVSTSDVTITVSYFQGASGTGVSTAVLAANTSLSWQPFKDVGGGEVQGTIADATAATGSVTINSTGAVVGRFVQINGTAAFAHNVEITP
ncbi:MAG: hypothetical protein COA73_12615 [Candidatus Hydrogenedentota bacterium]|nr:MAG: hypothetical protein COA73_12615 [Candidatus Hydrogenedentota bacterium]